MPGRFVRGSCVLQCQYYFYNMLCCSKTCTTRTCKFITLAHNGQIVSKTTTNGFPGEKVATSRSAISEKANRTQCRVYSVNITPLDTQPPLCAAHNTPLPRYPFPQVPRLTPAQRNNADGMCGSPNIRQVLRDMDTGAGKWDRGPGIGGWSTL